MHSSLFKDLNTPLEPISTGLEPRLPQLSDIRAIIFDIYGTLVISGTGDISIAEKVDREEVLRKFLGGEGSGLPANLSVSDVFYGLIKEDHQRCKDKGALFPEVDILEIWRGFLTQLEQALPDEKSLESMAIQFECAVNPVWPMPGMESVLNQLQQQELPLGIVSNAQFYTPVMLESFSVKPLAELGFQEGQNHKTAGQ